MAFVRSPFAHADISRVDAAAARLESGVVAVFTGLESKDDLPSLPTAAADHWPLRLPLTPHRVRYVGEPVAMVVAGTKQAALSAAEAVRVDYEPLDAVVDPWAALEDSAPLLHPDFGPTNKFGEIHKVIGDPDRAFAAADRVVRSTVVVQRVAASPIEPRAIIVEPDLHGGTLTIWLSCQAPHTLRTWLSQILGMNEARLRIVAPDVGGGFGSKLNLYCDEVAVMWAARKLGRTLRWTETRTENLTAGVHARDQIHHAELAVGSDGRILGLRSHFVGDLGAYLHFFTPVVADLTIDTLTGNYDIPAVDIHLEKVFTNTMSIEALRGSGRAEATFVLERLIDEAAKVLDIDPPEMRRRNLVTPEQMPYKTPFGMVYRSGDYPALLARVVEMADYGGFRERQDARRREGRYIGIGFATYNLLCGFSPSGHDWNPMKQFPGHETALIRVDPHGSVRLISGLSPHGQGSDTTLAQVVADRLQVPYDDIAVEHGDTALVPYGGGTHGSRGAVVGGHAALLAADRVAEKANSVAAAMLEASAEDIVHEDGGFFVRGDPGGARLSWQAVAFEAHFLKGGPRFEPGLEATAFYDPPDVSFAFGANAAVVEVDIDTGKVTILDFYSVDDAGVVLNPAIVRGQIHGGIAQGIGQALHEEIVHDEAGQITTANFATYRLPTALEVPEIHTDMISTPSETPLGVRGVGESGTLASPAAIVNAVNDALRPFGVVLNRTPLRPSDIWEAIHPE